MKETKEEYEFGGPIGASMIIVFSHFIPYYLWFCTELNNGSLAIPTLTMIKEILQHIKPTTISLSFYFGFLFFEAFLAYVIPGFMVEGLPLKHEGNKKLKYNCNAFQAWWITLFTVGVLYYTNIFKISILVNHLPSLILISSLFADFLALYLYCYTLLSKSQLRMSGNVLYDFFMGASLNPRIGALDLKMFAEGKFPNSIQHLLARVSWILLFLLNLSSALKQYETLGHITTSMWFILTAQFLYVNAIMKGEGIYFKFLNSSS
jgi:Delta24(24(1))-sterol reductase